MILFFKHIVLIRIRIYSNQNSKVLVFSAFDLKNNRRYKIISIKAIGNVYIYIPLPYCHEWFYHFEFTEKTVKRKIESYE